MRVDRFEPGGQPLWTRTLTVPDAATTTCTAIVRTVADTTILAGQVTRSPILAAIDADGEVEWSAEVDMGAGSAGPTIAALALAPSGEIIAVGSVHHTNDGAGIEFANPTGLAALDGNALLVSGYIGAPDVDAFLLRLANNGMPVWAKSYAGVTE